MAQTNMHSRALLPVAIIIFGLSAVHLGHSCREKSTNALIYVNP